ncbi:Hypp889 [Branchiostoma lanceolatum]|uniref:Hypp889 protein n=1 Tax=Branchiostoma lanceolatum TaxID=7740 RepID=A0A8J9VP54_BRALA|nr:Hypp889 [Branchiostoma lanceolatum]
MLRCSPDAVVFPGVTGRKIQNEQTLLRLNEESWSSGEEEEAERSLVSAWTSPLAVKLSIILVYTQLVVHHIQLGSTLPGSHTAVTTEESHTAVWQGLGLMRVLQIVALGGMYLYRLYSTEGDF